MELLIIQLTKKNIFKRQINNIGFLAILFICFSCNSNKNLFEKANLVNKINIEELPKKAFLNIPKDIVISNNSLFTTINFRSVLVHHINNGSLDYEFTLADTVYDELIKKIDVKNKIAYLNKAQFEKDELLTPKFLYTNITVKNDSTIIIGMTQNLIISSANGDTLFYPKLDFITELNIYTKVYNVFPITINPNYSIVTYSGIVFNNSKYFINALSVDNSTKFALVELDNQKNNFREIKIHLDSFLFNFNEHPEANLIFPIIREDSLKNYALSNLILDKNGKVIYNFSKQEFIISIFEIQNNSYIFKLYDKEISKEKLRYVLFDSNNLVVLNEDIKGIDNVGAIYYSNNFLYNFVKSEKNVILEKYKF